MKPLWTHETIIVVFQLNYKKFAMIKPGGEGAKATLPVWFQNLLQTVFSYAIIKLYWKRFQRRFDRDKEKV